MAVANRHSLEACHDVHGGSVYLRAGTTGAVKGCPQHNQFLGALI